MKNFNDVLEKYLENNKDKRVSAFNKVLEAIAKIRNVSVQDVLNYNNFVYDNEISVKETMDNILEKVQEMASEMDETLDIKNYFYITGQHKFHYDNKNNKWCTIKDMYETVYYENKDKYNWNIAINTPEQDGGYYEKHWDMMYDSFPNFFDTYINEKDTKRFEYITSKLKKEHEFLTSPNEKLNTLFSLYYSYKNKRHYRDDYKHLYIYKVDGFNRVKLDRVNLDELIRDGEYISPVYKWKVTPKNLFSKILKDNNLLNVEVEKLDKLLNKEMTLKR